MKMFYHKLLFMPIIFLFMIIRFSYSDNIVKVKEIEFRGLVFLSKFEIASKIETRADGDGIMVNMNSLVKALKEIPIISAYEISNSGGRLIVRIIEKKPYITLAVKRGNRLHPFEVDENFRVISRDMVYDAKNPVIVIGTGDLNDGALKEGVKKLCLFVKDFEKTNIGIYGQLSEIHINDRNSISVILAGRRTRFEISPDAGGFNRLKFITGYLDRVKYYPDKVYIAGNVAVIKP